MNVIDKPDALLLLIEDLELNHKYCPKEVILEAAAELRRLYMVDKLYRAALEGRNVMHLELHKANADRDALLGSLRKYVYLHGKDCVCEDCAAIAKAEENT